MESVQQKHAELLTEISNYIDADVNKNEFITIKTQLKIAKVINPKEYEEADTMLKMLDILEKKNYFGVGKYEKLKTLFDRYNVQISRDIIIPVEEDIQNILKCTEQTVAVYIHQSKRIKLDTTVSEEPPIAEKSNKKTLDEILTHLDVEEYQTNFEREKIFIQDFWNLSKDDLKEMGFLIAPRNRVLNFIEENKPSEVVVSVSTKLKLTPFQEELAKPAVEGENTIIYARTNAGKTYIAFYIVLQHLRKNPKGRVIFMARTNILLHQQYLRALEVFVDKDMRIYCFKAGEDLTDFSVSECIQSHNIFFMTPGLLVNNLQNRLVNITDLTLLVFDECHHTVGLANYNKVMSYYRKAKFDGPGSDGPQVLGLTASPNIKKAREVSEAIKEIRTLMENLDVSHLSTVVKQRDDYKQYFEDPVNVSLVVTPRDDDQVQVLLNDAMSTVEDMLKLEAKKYNEDKIFDRIEISDPPVERSAQRYDQWVTTISTYLKQIKFSDQNIGRFLVTCCRNLQVYHNGMHTNLLLDYKDVKEVLEEGYDEFEYESQSDDCLDSEKELVKILKDVIQKIPNEIGSNPDIEKIKSEIRREFVKRGDDSRFLVFITERMFAKKLAHRLSTELRCHHLTGCHTDNDNAASKVFVFVEIPEKGRMMVQALYF